MAFLLHSIARATAGRFQVRICLLVLLTVTASFAQPESMTRTEIINLAKPAVGHGYHWGHGNWTTDGSNIGTCSGICGQEMPGQPPSCTFSSSVGADCSGFVAKVWQVPNPSPVEQDFHPYSTADFKNSSIHWENIAFEDVRRGDALVRRSGNSGHIVLVDHKTTKGFMTYEASACKTGIKHWDRTIDASYSAIRRHDIVEEVCTPQSCSGNGICLGDGECQCDFGFDGDRCDRCYEGFVGYPTCRQAGSCPTIHGALKCGDQVLVTPEHGSYELSDYNCGPTGLGGGEFVFEFRPLGAGSAVVTADANSTDGTAAVMLLRNACDAELACVDYHDSELEFDYGASEPFYIVVDSTDYTGDVLLSVECELESSNWIGDFCDSDADCPITDWSGNAIGRCYRFEGGSFCTSDCTGSCPDIPGKARTFCVEDPSDTSQGICVSKADRLNKSCADISGTTSIEATRFKNSAKSAQVCMPGTGEVSCLGVLSGSVVESGTFEPIVGATVTIEGQNETLNLTSAADGGYEAPDLACGAYTITIEADGYLKEEISIEVIDFGVDIVVAQLEALSEGECAGPSRITGSVIDGISNEPIADATIQLTKGVDNIDGEVIASTASDANGAFNFDALDAGHYTATVAAPGYSSPGTAIFRACSSSENGQNIYLTADHIGRARFVLTWQRPNDLDLHLQLPSGEEVFFGECSGELDAYPYAELDVDHINADGPESITVANLLPGPYTLFVHNYSGQNEDAAASLSQSGARVTVYGPDNQVLQRFSPPGAGVGHFWDVVSFDGSDILGMQPLNRFRSDRPNLDAYGGQCTP